MANTLGLDDDMDPVELVLALEESFALRISDAEAESCETAGDVFDLLRARFADRPGACMTSMAFYRLRRALTAEHGPGLRPDTPLAGLAKRNPRVFLRRLKAQTGLRMPPLEMRALGCAGATLGLSGIVALLARVEWPWWLLAIAAIPLSVLLIRLEPGGFLTQISTLGDLTAWVAPRNYGRLAGEGGAVSDESLWRAMTEVFAEFSELPQSEVRRDTWLLADRPKAA